MIAGCPKCSARYRVDAERIGEGGAKLRCTRCSAVFLVRTPKAPRAPVPPAAPAPAAVALERPIASSSVMSSPSEAAPDRDSARLVLIADPSEERGKQTAAAVESWGLEAHRVQDGVAAMLAVQRMLPRVIVLDAALPRMRGLEVCEIVKRNESLRHIKVVLVGGIQEQDRDRNEPSDRYGADIDLEQPDLPDGLLPLLREAGLPASVPPKPEPAAPRPTPVAVAPAPAPGPFASAPVASRSAGVAEAPDERSAERERAERLARIAVSEMVLYQPDKFDRAVQEGNLQQVLDLEIQEARALIRQRIGEEVRAEKDFILDELSRVARARRGAQA